MKMGHMTHAKCKTPDFVVIETASKIHMEVGKSPVCSSLPHTLISMSTVAGGLQSAINLLIDDTISHDQRVWAEHHSHDPTPVRDVCLAQDVQASTFVSMNVGKQLTSEVVYLKVALLRNIRNICGNRTHGNTDRLKAVYIVQVSVERIR